jgi:hypothetical protein
MAFTSIPASIINVGKAIKKEIFTYIKDDLDDLDSRLNTVETNAKKISIFEYMVINATPFSTATGFNYFEATSDFTLTDAYIRIFEKGSLAGTFEIDILVSTTNLDSTSFVSVFTTKPKITFASASDYDASTNQVFDNTKININTGDYLRLDITAMPTGGVMSKFIIKAYGE